MASSVKEWTEQEDPDHLYSRSDEVYNNRDFTWPFLPVRPDVRRDYSSGRTMMVYLF